MTVYVVYDYGYDRIITATHNKSLAYELAEKFGAMVTPYDNAEFLRNKVWSVFFDEQGKATAYDRSDSLNIYLYDKAEIGKISFAENSFQAQVTIMCDTGEEAIDVAKQLYKTAVFAKLKRRKNEQN